MVRRRFTDYWCCPQAGGHAPMYSRGDRQISRADYIDAVGAADCDPHLMVGVRKIRRRVVRKMRIRRRSA